MEIITKKCKFTLKDKSYKMDILILYPYEKLENIKGITRIKNIEYNKNYDEYDLPEQYKQLGAMISVIINNIIKSHTGYDKNFYSIMVGENELNEKIFYLSFAVSPEVEGRRLLDFNMDDNGNYYNLKKIIKEHTK